MNITRTTKIIVIFALLTIICSACGFGPARIVVGSGNIVEESRQVRGVSGVNLATIGNLTIELGDTESFSVEADDNLMEYFKTSVVGGVLRIEVNDRVNLNPSSPIKYSLTVKSLESIKVTSVGVVFAPALTADEFSVTIASTGKVSIPELTAEQLTVDISSTGNLDIDGGIVKYQDIKLSSSGNYNAEDLASEEAKVNISRTGSATIWVENTLSVKLNSTGDLYYRGDPTVDQTTNSTGNVNRITE